MTVDQGESLLGLVEGIDDVARNVRFMRMDHSITGAQSRENHAAAFAFLHVIEAFRFARPQADSLLALGLGAGSVPTALHPQGKKFDVVEIDPLILQMAQKHFGFVSNGEVFRRHSPVPTEL